VSLTGASPRARAGFEGESLSVQLSIIVPVFQVESYLGRCLESLLDQGLKPDDYEIVVIDDGSRDRSLAIAESYARAHRNILIHGQEHQGPGVARNAGIAIARGRYLLFVDSDDFLTPRMLESLVNLMGRERLQMLGFRYVAAAPDDQLPDGEQPLPAFDAIEVVSGLQYLAGQNYHNSVWSYLLDRQFLIDTGIRFEPGRYVEDAIFTANVLSAASRMAFVPVVVYHYVQRPGSIMRTQGDAHALEMIAAYERVVFGLDELRERLSSGGWVQPGALARIRLLQQSFVFFLIGRLVRSQLPARPLLPEALARFRVIGAYPLDCFPSNDYPGVRYRLLTIIFNQESLLYPFIRGYRLAVELRPSR